MANEVKVFDNLKVKEENGQVFFDAESAAYGIGLTQTKKGILYVRWERVNNLLKNSPRVGKGDYLTEPQFYRLATKADSPQAEKFQDWVTSEVLPSIRKTGSYSVQPMDDFDKIALIAQGTTKLKEQVNGIETKVDTYIENQAITATDSNAIARAVSKRVHQYGALHHINRDERGPLFKDLNRQIKEVTGAGNRSRIKSKDYDMVIEFIENWEPTTATKMLMEQTA
ncbi:BRO family protein [Fructobacillus fructosus]|uniref:BRO family protein n=1 Tax=Fructobacillus fructosus TaxID=1631 RepID=UPI00200B09CA|nr:ORF6C domain-containing protein [Fructobacillus fructosus]MCK8639041.1 ORF6C domain-containing protein [Fructobacillus fructosus]